MPTNLGTYPGTIALNAEFLPTYYLHAYLRRCEYVGLIDRLPLFACRHT